MGASADWVAIGLTLRLAATTTILLLIVATPIAWWLARARPWVQDLAVPLIAMPLVLPPTVLGFYLLLLLGTHGPIGHLTEKLGWGTLAFTFPGLVIGSMIYSFPFVAQQLHVAFRSIDERLLEAAATLHAGPLDRICSVVVPLTRSSFIGAAVLAFAHTVGEFGVVLMIGGNIPGKTQTISLAIYNHVEAMEYAQAHWLAGGMVVFSLAALLAVQVINRRSAR